MDEIPHGLLILQRDTAYMGARDWYNKKNEVMDIKGILPFETAFPEAADRDGFNAVVAGKTGGMSLDDIVGHLVITEDGESDRPLRPSVCVFRLVPGGPHFVARDLLAVFGLAPERDGVFGVGEGALLTAFHAQYRTGIDAPPPLAQEPLQTVFSALTITKPVLESESGNSADYGDSADYSGSADFG